MSNTLRSGYRLWRSGVRFTKMAGLALLVGIVGWSICYDRWITHNVRPLSVVLQTVADENPFISFDEGCAEDYDRESHATGLEARERLLKIRQLCGAFVQNGDTALLLQKRGPLYRVRVTAGSKLGLEGWITERAIAKSDPSSDPRAR